MTLDTHDSVSFLDIDFSGESDLRLVASTKKIGHSASLIYSVSLGGTCCWGW